MGETCQRRGFALGAVLFSSRGSRSAKNHREIFNVPGTRETVDWGYSSDSVQWAISLGCAARDGSPGRIRSRSARDLDPLLLARSGTRIRRRNIMAVAHGTEKQRLLEHKAAIDVHLGACGIPVSYTNVFWGGRSEIKPSEISPIEYREWLQRQEVPA